MVVSHTTVTVVVGGGGGDRAAQVDPNALVTTRMRVQNICCSMEVGRPVCSGRPVRAHGQQRQAAQGLRRDGAQARAAPGAVAVERSAARDLVDESLTRTANARDKLKPPRALRRALRPTRTPPRPKRQRRYYEYYSSLVEGGVTIYRVYRHAAYVSIYDICYIMVYSSRCN